MTVLELTLMERIRRDYGVDGMEDLFLRLDLLHDFVSTGRLADATPLAPAELRGWLEDISFTVRETLRELDAAEASE